MHEVVILSDCCGSATNDEHIEAISMLTSASKFTKNLHVREAQCLPTESNQDNEISSQDSHDEPSLCCFFCCP